MNEAGSVLKAQSSVVYSQQLRQGVPDLLIIMDNIISIHVSVELHPVNFLIQRQNIWVGEIGICTVKCIYSTSVGETRASFQTSYAI